MYARPLSLRGLGADVASTGIFSDVLSADTYLSNIAQTLNNTGGMDPAQVQQTLQQALVNNYCTPQNPDPACSNPSAAASLVAKVGSTVTPAPAGPAVEVFTPAPVTQPQGVYSNWTPSTLNTSTKAPAVVAPTGNAAPAPVNQTQATGTGPAPVVSSNTPVPATQPTVLGIPVPAIPSWFTDPAQELISGIPNWILLGGLAVVATFMFSGHEGHGRY